ncbi:MAG: hypothetical protein Q8R11_03670 [bacterium]|nr:hypothetical protein [bacterium]
MERLPEHHFPLQDLELERTDLYLSWKPKENAPFILIGARDPGGANALLPVLRSLLQSECQVGVLTDSKAKEMLSTKLPDFFSYHNLDPLRQVASMRPDAVVVGLTSFQPGIEMTLTANAAIDGIPVVWVEDYPGCIFPHYRDIQTVPWLLPDVLCVANEWAKQRELDANPTFSPEKVIVTGLPNLDRIAHEDRIGTRVRVREELGISPNETLIVYMGIPTEANLETLHALVQALRHFPQVPIRLVNRRHPRDTIHQSFYKEILSPFGDQVIDTDTFSTDDIGLSADLVVTTYSTTGIESVYRQIPTLHILIPEIIAKAESSNIEDPIVVQDGASPCARTKGEIAPLLERFFFDPVLQTTLVSRMRHWTVDGMASKRIAELILQLTQIHRNA